MSGNPLAPPRGEIMNLPGLFTKRRQPLHVHISAVFTLLILISGAIVGWYNYKQTSNILLSASNDLFERIGRETVLEIDRIYAPIGLLTDIVANQQLANATSFDERLRLLPALGEALVQNPAMSAIYVGYANGDFFLLRPLPVDENLRSNLGAPPAAAYLVQSVVRRAAGAIEAKFVYLDLDYKPLLTVERPDYAFDPRGREWYKLAMASSQRITTNPYVFFTTRDPGITIARRGRRGTSVVGADITLAEVSSMLRKHIVTPSAELVLFDAEREALAYTRAGRPLWREQGDSTLRLVTLSDLGGPALGGLAKGFASGTVGRNFDFEAGGDDWIARISKISTRGQDVYLGMYAPREELLHDANRLRTESAVISVVILLLMIPIAWLLSRAIARPLRELSAEAGAIQRFKFDQGTGASSFVQEIDDLARAIDIMRATIRKFLEISSALAAESDIERLLDRVVADSLALSGADAAVVYLFDDDGKMLVPANRSWREASRMPVESTLAPLNMQADTSNEIVVAAREGCPRVGTLQATDTGATASYFNDAFQGLGIARLGVAAIPLHNRQHEVIGVLAFGRGLDDDASAEPFPAELISFMTALSGTVAVSIEARRLLKSQKDLLAALIQLVASAIDAKSPYTGGHCQRVPELAKMLAGAACDAKSGPFRDFSLSDDEWEAVHIASWLHDCGKVTTPEYVVDKATKLETIYDRIHEVRMRFEVLKRDAEIDCLKSRAAGGDETALKRELATKLAELDAEFEFIAECNVGGEFMAPERIERLRQIAQRTWQRTLDDRAGISQDEFKRKARMPVQPLPATERLLADKDEHVFERGAQDQMPPDNEWGFKMQVPVYKLNKGEFHNLCVGRGTLTDEERFIINDHVVQTIIMLTRLPFPKHLKKVPEIAGGHHEKMDGTGYPKRLKHAELSPVARMLVIADIFEALTAADRPYKKGKTLSESIKIMGFMRKDRHIDADLFELFLTSGVYRRYAEHFMRPEQIDDVDIKPYLSAA